jgi:hypothetical protein
MGFPMTIVAKAVMIYWSENLATAQQKNTADPLMSAAWTGAAVNNLTLLVTLNPTVSITAGLVTAWLIWQSR